MQGTKALLVSQKSETSNDYACQPACVPCRKQRTCIVPSQEARQARSWAPNSLPNIKMPCGCVGIPWPLIHVFGTNIYELDCPKHGTVRYTVEQKKRVRRKAQKIAAERMASLFDDEDIPF